jgi:aminomethyltransferase
LLVGFIIDGRRTPRHENKITVAGKEAGFVTSGAFSPHLNKGIGMGYVDPAVAAEGNEIEILLERGSVKAIITKPPFLKETSLRQKP